jgi:hypothetical protein
MRPIVILVFSLLATVAHGGTATENVVWVRVYDAVIQSSPSFVSESTGRVHFTQSLQVLGSSNAWYHVATGDRQSRFAYDPILGWGRATNAVTLEGWIHSSSVTTNSLPSASMIELTRPTALWSGHGGSNEAMRMMKELEHGQQSAPPLPPAPQPGASEGAR